MSFPDNLLQHADDCFLYKLTRPLCYAPAYLVYISYSPNDIGELWYEGIIDDNYVTETADTLLQDMTNRVAEYDGELERIRSDSKYYLFHTNDGIKADLTAITSLVSNVSRP